MVSRERKLWLGDFTHTGSWRILRVFIHNVVHNVIKTAIAIAIAIAISLGLNASPGKQNCPTLPNRDPYLKKPA